MRGRETMPKEFAACVKGGGKVRRKTLSDGRYINICYPKGGGPGIAGEVHEREGEKLMKLLKGGK